MRSMASIELPALRTLAGRFVGRRALDDPEWVLARHARTFHFAARFLPAEKRRPVTVLYALCRTLDDLVDEPGPGWTVEATRAELEQWRRWARASGAGPAPREPLGSQAAAVLHAYAIPSAYVLELIDGLSADLDRPTLMTEDDLARYCYQVASTVGLMMAHILGCVTPTTLVAAAELGAAMQRTNVLRDVGADLARGRLYLPADELARHGLTREHLLALRRTGGGSDDRFRTLMRSQIARARQAYARGLEGVWLLPPDCRLPILVAGRLYERILRAIERNDYDVLCRRASTNRVEKLAETALAASHARWPRQRDLAATGDRHGAE